MLPAELAFRFRMRSRRHLRLRFIKIQARQSRQRKHSPSLQRKRPLAQAVTSRDQMFNLQRSLLEKPQVAPAAELLDSQFMQSPQADNRTKTSFLKMALNQAAKGGTDVSVGGLKHAAAMMGKLVESGVGSLGQRSALSMVERRPTDTGAMERVAGFPSSTEVGSQSKAVKTKATALLAKANGDANIADGFKSLVSSEGFKVQSAANQSKMFSAIGSAKTQDYRAMTDLTLDAIRSPEFQSALPMSVLGLRQRLNVFNRRTGRRSLSPDTTT